MKNFSLILTFLFLGSGVAFGQTSIFVTNSTGVDLFGLHSSDVENPDWGDDLLPEDLFDNESEVEITFPEGFNCEVDIMVTYDADLDGEIDAEIKFFEMDICEISGIELFSDGTYEIY